MRLFPEGRFLLWSAVSIILLSVGASGIEDPAVQCFSFLQKDVPLRTPLAESHREKWCYLDRTVHGDSYTLVFNADEDRLRPELAALVKKDGSGRLVEITHGSLNHGKLSILRSNLTAVNPMPVPLGAQEAAQEARPLPFEGMDNVWLQAERRFNSMLDTKVRPFRLQLSEGVFEAKLEDKLLPFDAYWWPFAEVALAAGDYSPLGKYDNIVSKWTGTNPDSIDWEKRNHSLQNVAWGGHCNGWAASSVLYPEPTKYLWDSENKKVLYPSDSKGMLAEASLCVNWAFYGHRNYGKAGDDLLDIYPDKFHQVLVYYFDQVKKPVAMDYFRNDWVDNSVITGYKMTVTKDSSDAKKWHVVADLRVHHYERYRNENRGPAEFSTRTYWYALEVDDDGNVVKGTWEGNDNPDFLWVPLAQRNCNGENPHVDPNYVEKIISTLPEATERKLSLNFQLNRPVAPHEIIEVPFTPVPGLALNLHVGASDYPGLRLEVVGYPMYPTSNEPGVTMVSRWDLEANHDVDLSLNDVSQIRIVNDSNSPVFGSLLELTHLSYLGGD